MLSSAPMSSSRLLRRVLGLSFVGVLFGSSLAACGDDTGTGGSATGGAAGTGGGTGGSGGGALTGTPVKVLNWNVHNFYDTVDDPASQDYDAMTQAEFQARVESATAVISGIDPDVLVLQEVENETVLTALNDALGNKYPTQHIVQGNDPRGVDIAALSKLPFTDVVSHLDESFVVEGTQGPSFNFTRDLLEYHFTVGNQKVVLLGVHYKAKGTPTSPDNPDKRLAEAQKTRAVADALTTADPNLAVVILGDCNDTPGSPPLKALVGSNPAYVDAADSITESDRWTFDFNGSLELIDHQMMNPVAAGRLDPASVSIEHSTDAGATSDHSPLTATYYFE